MTAEEYAQVNADVKAAVAAVITGVVTVEGVVTARVLTEDPVNLDEAQWEGELLSANDLDDNGDKRVHAWIVTEAGSDDLASASVNAIEPTLRYRVQFFLRHEPGSQARAAAEALKVQFELSKAKKLSRPGVVTRHAGLPFRTRLARMGKTIVHRLEGEVAVEVQPVPLG